MIASSRVAAFVATFAATFAACASAFAADAPPVVIQPATVSDTMGVNIHFIDPQPGEMEMIKDAGFRFVRMDLTWDKIETKKGEYDFTAYDRLATHLQKNGLKGLFIFDYGNPFYDNGGPARSDEARKAFTDYALACVDRYQGKGFVWETLNEPNAGFWKPTPEPDKYARLALDVAQAIHAKYPNEILVGPALSMIDLRFLANLRDAKLLDYWSGFSIHPYRQTVPETVEGDYLAIRQLMYPARPAESPAQILAGEWGYSTIWAGVTEQVQAEFAVRQFLVNLSQDIPLTIWYDWHDDGINEKNAEHHYGLLRWLHRDGQSEVYEPKPAYLAVKTLGTQLGAMVYDRRLWTGRPQDYVLLFKSPDGKSAALAAWTAGTPGVVDIPVGDGQYDVVTLTGEPGKPIAAASGKLHLSLTAAVQYLKPQAGNDGLLARLAQPKQPREILVKAPADAKVADGTFNVQRGDAPRMVMTKDQTGAAQAVVVAAANPVSADVQPQRKRLAVRIINEGAEATDLSIHLTGLNGLKVGTGKMPLKLDAGQYEGRVFFPIATQDTDARAAADILSGERVIAKAPPIIYSLDTWTPDDVEWASDGDKALTSNISVKALPADENLDAPILETTYEKQKAGWKFWRLVPKKGGHGIDRPSGKPTEYGLWIKGDASRNTVKLRFHDSAGQTYQTHAYSLDWTGWKFVRFVLNEPGMSSWGGPHDGQIHYPIRFDCPLLLETATGWYGTSTIAVGGPIIIR